MIDPITAPSTVNRFDGLLDGTQATALRFVYHTMTLEPSAGQFEMPSGRMVSDHDPEYLDWCSIGSRFAAPPRNGKKRRWLPKPTSLPRRLRAS